MAKDHRYTEDLTTEEERILDEAMREVERGPLYRARRVGDDRLWRVENAMARYLVETR